MSRGVSLGGAVYTLDATAAPLIAAMAQAEQASAKSVQAIAQQLGKSEKDVQRLAQSWLSAEKQRADASAAATLKIIKAHNEQAAAAAKASLSLDDLIKHVTGVGLAAGGMLAAVEIATKGFEKLTEAVKVTTEATLAADQAQRQLTATYGSAAPQMKGFADQLAASFSRTNTEVETGVARMAVLQRQYGLTSDEIEKLTKVALNLGATFGDNAESIRSVQAAIRGEPEALEKYGIALQQNAIQNNDLLTASEKKNFASLDAVTQARIRYQIILQQSAQFEGAAAARAASLQGGFDKMERATNNLEVALGKVFVPTISKTSGLLGELTDRVAATVEAMSKLPSAQSPAEKTLDAVGLAALRAAGPVGQIVAGLIQINRDFGPTATPTSDTGVQFGPSPADINAIRDKRKAAEAERIADLKRARQQEGKDQIDAAEDRHRSEVKGLDDRKTLLEAEREVKRRTVEDERDTALKGLEEEARAAKATSDAKIAGLRAEETEAKRVAEQRHQDAVRGLEAEKQGVEDATAENIRALEIERDHRKQAAEDQRDDAIKALEAATRVREHGRVEEDRALEDHNKLVQRTLEDQAKAAERRFDREAQAAERTRDRTIRSLEKQSKAEDDRHRKALDHIESEAKKATDAIDAQIAAIDAARKARENASRTSGLQGKVTDAQTALQAATGTGTAAEVAAAREELTRAIRGGDQTSVTNAQERLKQLAGQGPAAVKAAQENLNKVLKDLQDEQTSEAEDAEKQRLQAEKDRIKAEADAEKQAEEDKNRRRKDRLDKDKQAAGDTYKSAKDGIDKRKQDEKDAHDLAVQQSRDVAEKAKRDVDDRRRKEDEADQDKRREITATYELEQRQLKATYDDEATGSIPALRRALDAYHEHYSERKRAADDAARDEQQQIQDTYNDPQKGLIPLAERAAAAVQQHYQDMAADVRKSAQDQTQAINDQYHNAAGTGLIDLIEQARKDSEEKLQKQRDYWTDWAEEIGGDGDQARIQKVRNKLAQLKKDIEALGGTVSVGVNTSPEPGQGDQPSGSTGGAGSSGSPATVPSPYRVTFPFDAPYNGSFAGGAAWEGGPSRHRGIDLALPGSDNGRGSVVGAFQPGRVVTLTDEDAGGKGVILQTPSGLYNYYGHFDRQLVKDGEQVARGQGIGTLGRTGLDGGMQTHVHYEVRRGINGDPVGSTIDPVPYMGGGSASAGGRVVEFDLFGRHYKITVPGGAAGSGLIQAIERLGEQIDGREFGRAAASIALSEGADGDLSHAGSGGAWGPFQFDPTGQLPNYATYLHKSVDEAGPYAGSHPMNAAAWALQGYLGKALRDGLDAGLKGADLAEYGSLVGQAPEGDNYKRAGVASRQLWGYRNGGWISPNSVIIDAAGSPYARTEGFSERVLSPEQSATWAGSERAPAAGDTIIVNGHSTSDVVSAIERAQHKQRVLYGGLR